VDKDALIPREGLWSEDSDRVWLPLEYGDTPERVKRLAFAGRDLPITPAREFSPLRYSDIGVRRVFVRPGYPWESGWAGSGADTWWLASSSRDPNVVGAWEVRFD
jgi:hypothetical protein